MATPESKVKQAVRKALASFGVHPFMDVATGKVQGPVAGTYYMPVAGPFSVHGVHDFVGCWHGIFWSIETKAPENPEDATVHQENFRLAVTLSGGISLVGVRDASAVLALRELVRSRCGVSVSDLNEPTSKP